MRARTIKRYFIKSSGSRELVCPSLADLHALYTQGFLSDEDLVRADGSERWVAAGSMPALRGARHRRASPRKLALVIAAGACLAFGLAMLVRALR